MRNKILIGVSGVLTVTIAGFLLYSGKANEEALEIAGTMETAGNSHYFMGDSNVGFIVFSGAKIDERAYAYMAQLLHQEGHTVVIPRMPFQLSMFGINRGLKIIESNPNINKWILVGHSLGGVPAGRIALRVPEKIIGVAMIATYMSTDMSELDISAIRIMASNDENLIPSMAERNLHHLPENSTSAVIEGANHNGFAAFDALGGDDAPATITWKQQQEQTVRLMLDFFDAQIHENNKKKEQ